MITFKHATMLPYPVHLNYEQIDKIFTFCSDRADQATKGNRSVWGLRWTGNTLTVAFKRKRDWDQFDQVFQPRTATGSASPSERNCGEKRPKGTRKLPRKDAMPSYMLACDFLDTEQVGDLGAVASEVADIVTGDDRSAYEVWFHNNEVHVGFKHEEDRDEFAEILDKAAADEFEAIDLPPPAAASLPSISVH